MTPAPTTSGLQTNIPALSDRAFEKTQLKEAVAELETRLLAGETSPQLLKDGAELQDRIRAFKEALR